MLRIRQAGDVDEIAVLHIELLRRLVHQLREHILRARHRLGERDGGVVAALYDHAANEHLDCWRLLGVDKHARPLGFPRPLGNRDGLGEREFLGTQRIKDQVRGHDLGERSRLKTIIQRLTRQHLAATCVIEHIGASRQRRGRNISLDGRQLREGGGGGKQNESREQYAEIHLGLMV